MKKIVLSMLIIVFSIPTLSQASLNPSDSTKYGGIEGGFSQAEPVGDMKEFFGIGKGFSCGINSYTFLGGANKDLVDLYVKRLGVSYGINFTYLDFDHKIDPRDHYQIYQLQWSIRLYLSIFMLGMNAGNEFISVKLYQFKHDYFYNDFGIFFLGGVSLPLFTEHVSVLGYAKYGWTLPARAWLSNGTTDRTIHFNMHYLSYHLGAELKI